MGLSSVEDVLFEELGLKEGNLFVDPLWETYSVHDAHKFHLVVFLDVITHVLQHRQDLVHFSVDHLVFEHLKNCDGGLEEDKDPVQEVEVPHSRH